MRKQAALLLCRITSEEHFYLYEYVRKDLLIWIKKSATLLWRPWVWSCLGFVLLFKLLLPNHHYFLLAMHTLWTFRFLNNRMNIGRSATGGAVKMGMVRKCKFFNGYPGHFRSPFINCYTSHMDNSQTESRIAEIEAEMLRPIFWMIRRWRRRCLRNLRTLLQEWVSMTFQACCLQHQNKVFWQVVNSPWVSVPFTEVIREVKFTPACLSLEFSQFDSRLG